MLADLAKRPDFRIGSLFVSPARRRIEGPGGESHVEPLIMQALLLLLDARGDVVTRKELFDQLWGQGVVGDDSLNRAIARVRRIDGEVGPGLFGIETIPRTGYRLTGDILTSASTEHGSGDSRRIPRRTLIIGAGAAAGVGGLGYWTLQSRRDAEFNALMSGIL